MDHGEKKRIPQESTLSSDDIQLINVKATSHRTTPERCNESTLESMDDLLSRNSSSSPSFIHMGRTGLTGPGRTLNETSIWTHMTPTQRKTRLIDNMRRKDGNLPKSTLTWLRKKEDSIISPKNTTNLTQSIPKNSIDHSPKSSEHTFTKITEGNFYSSLSVTLPCYRVHFGLLVTAGDVHVQFNRHSLYINATSTTPEVLIYYTDIEKMGFHRERPFTLVLVTRKPVHKDISKDQYDPSMIDMTSM
jgi:hypothetical protein